MIEIMMVSDFACPFCYLGFSAMKKLKEERDDVSIKFIPFLLNPHESLEGSDLSKHISEEAIEGGFARIERLASEYGLSYNNKNKQFNTNRLHRAALYAEEVGRSFEFCDLAFKYIFEYGKNVGQEDIVNEIGSSLGLDLEDMNRKIDQGYYEEAMIQAGDIEEEYNVRSVPTFIVNGMKKPSSLKKYKILIRNLLEE